MRRHPRGVGAAIGVPVPDPEHRGLRDREPEPEFRDVDISGAIGGVREPDDGGVHPVVDPAAHHGAGERVDDIGLFDQADEAADPVLRHQAGGGLAAADRGQFPGAGVPDAGDLADLFLVCYLDCILGGAGGV